MTITYTLDVSTSNFSSFIKLLLRWRGSIWKSVYRELLVWLVVYFALSALYRLCLDDQQRVLLPNVRNCLSTSLIFLVSPDIFDLSIFEDLVVFCYNYKNFIPLTFMFGFFITLVLNRWWDMFKNIGWVDNTALYIAAYIQGKSERARIIRRNILRYLVLIQALTFRDISVKVRRRFPTMETLQAAGFMSVAEMKALDGIVSPHRKYWLPAHWAMTAIVRARQEGLIKSDHAVQDLLNRVREYRTSLAWLSCYDWVPIPLVYTQVVFLMVRCYFLFCLMARQYITNDTRVLNTSPIDLYFPIISTIQFVFVMGWLKVAEALLNPMGDDDDDFEVNWLLDRNLQMGLSVVDDAVGKEPPMERDVFWEESQPEPLYSTDSAGAQANPLLGSATEIDLRGRTDGVGFMMVSRASSEKNVQLDGISVGTVRPTHPPVFVRSTSQTSSMRSNGLFARLNVSPVMAIRRKFCQRSSQLGKETQRKVSFENENGVANIPQFVRLDSIAACSTTSSAVSEPNDQGPKAENSATNVNGNQNEATGSKKKAEISRLVQQDQEKSGKNRYLTVSNENENELSDVTEEDEVLQNNDNS